jgi:hypothetical protein
VAKSTLKTQGTVTTLRPILPKAPAACSTTAFVSNQALGLWVVDFTDGKDQSGADLNLDRSNAVAGQAIALGSASHPRNMLIGSCISDTRRRHAPTDGIYPLEASNGPEVSAARGGKVQTQPLDMRFAPRRSGREGPDSREPRTLGWCLQCLLFDTTVNEIRRILSMYESRLATEQGRRSLRPVPMPRHFLTKQYSPST